MGPTLREASLERVDRGRRGPWPVAILVAGALLGTAWLGLSGREPAPDQRAELLPTTEVAADHSPGQAPSPATATPPPRAIHGGDGLAGLGRFHQPRQGPFVARLVLPDSETRDFWLEPLANGDFRARVELPFRLWGDRPVLSVVWLGAGVPGWQEITRVPLSLGTASEIGLPVKLARGHAVLPRAEAGRHGWSYQVNVVRAHGFSHPHQMAVEVELTTGRYPTLSPAELFYWTCGEGPYLFVKRGDC